MKAAPQEHHILLQCVAADFERLATTLERAIETFASDQAGTLDLGALQRACDAARRGAKISRNALDGVRR